MTQPHAIELTAITGAAVSGRTADGYYARIELATNRHNLVAFSVGGAGGFSHDSAAPDHTTALSECRRIITSHRRRFAGLSPDERALAAANDAGITGDAA